MNIATTAFDLVWGTNIAGSKSYIKYSKDQNLTSGTSTLTANSAVSHTASLIGLTPATIYYAKVYSINGSDTATSSIKTFCTKSNSSGIIKSYYTRSVDNTVASSANNATALIGLVDDTLISYINRAKSELEIAIYNWDNSSGITNAVNAAAARGVKVRIVYDGSTAQSGLNTISAACKIVASPQGANYTIMHNKFVVIDVNSPMDAIVWTGSTNWTSQQLNTDAFVPHRVEADVHAVEPRGRQFVGHVREAQAIRGHRDAGTRRDRREPGNQRGQPRPQQWLAAGQPNLGDAEDLHRDARQAHDLVVGEQFGAGQPLHAVGRHAVRAPQRAPVRQREPQVGRRAAEGVRQAS